jgi:hypothetical protein
MKVMRNRLIPFVALFVPAAFMLMAVTPLVATAQTAAPYLQITWHAMDSSAPSYYQDKLLPGTNSPVVASAEVISNGTVVNLSGQTIYWYLDENLVGSGVGKQTITFQTAAFDEIASLRVEVPNYPSGGLINTAHIPLQDPEAVIVAPYPGDEYGGSSISVQGVPYYFPASELNQLSYQWLVNGQLVTSREDPQDLTINLATGTSTSGDVPVAIGLSISGGQNSSMLNAQSSIDLNPAS